MSVSIFDILNLMESTKPSWDELTDEQKKAYSPFMINRFVSSKKQYLPILAKVATLKLTPEQHYTLINSLLSPQKHYFDYKAYKTTKMYTDEQLYALRQEFKIGNKDAKRYAEFLSEVELRELTARWKPLYDAYK